MRWAPRRAVTLIELLVAGGITIIIAVAILGFLQSARHATELAKAKGEAKNIAEVILRAMEKDIAASHAEVQLGTNNQYSITKSLTPSAGGWTMLVGEAKSYKRVEYRWNSGTKTLERADASASTRILSNKVEFLELTNTSDQQVTIEIKVGVIPAGQREALLHEQRLLVAVREAVSANMDPKWRNSQDVLSNF